MFDIRDDERELDDGISKGGDSYNMIRASANEERKGSAGIMWDRLSGK